MPPLFDIVTVDGLVLKEFSKALLPMFPSFEIFAVVSAVQPLKA